MRKYYDAIILAESPKINYEFLNQQYDGVTGNDVYSYFRKTEKYSEIEKEELIKNALVYLNMKYAYPIRDDMFTQFEKIDFDEDEKK